ncbi:MAG: winged helix-turn-helix transcriptional regulator [Oceanospirillaceae bacterium]|nr:winged helix-turn-helix transcriptional regulator [Oceanospirillaceae bacterium]
MSDKFMQKSKLTAEKVRTSSSGWMIKSLAKKLDNKMLAALKPNTLNLGQFAIMMVLLEQDNISQAQIGESVSMPAYATTRNINVLEHGGYLERHENTTSRRSYRICLTVKGRSLAAILFPIVQSINSKVFAPLTAAEDRQLKYLLMKVISEEVKS